MKKKFISLHMLALVICLSIFIGYTFFNKKSPQVIGTDSWKTYTNNEAGFSLKYPSYITLIDQQDPSKIILTITAEKLSDIPEDLPMFMGRDYALKEKAQLENKKGETDISLGKLNGVTNVVLSRFEVCSVIMDRRLTFYPNDYKVTLTFSAPIESVMTDMPEFFMKDSENCGNQTVWNRESSENFISTLLNNKGKGIAQIWYNTFEEVVGTIELN